MWTATPFEFRVGTIFDTHIYTVLAGGESVHYILRHNPASGEPSDDVLIAASRFVAPYDSFTGHYYIGSPFDTEIFIEFVDGESVQFIGIDRTPQPGGNIPHGYVPPNLYNREEFSPGVSVVSTQQIPLGRQYIGDLPVSFIIFCGVAFVVLILLFLYAQNAQTKPDKNKARDDWNEKFNKIKEDARQARIDRGYNPDKFN
ncbi:MAG: hypothetical protein FWC70_06240 [Defluviitaleaceae bacterium]|nr:hypothetical protein [Defluviitaleaceae bacterium]